MSTADQQAQERMRRVRRVQRRRRREDQRGIVLVWMALSLVAMMMFAALMVDLGAWYKQSQDLQRTADAAALAGSTYLPNSPGAAPGTFVPALATQNPPNCPSNWLTSGVTDATCAALKTIYKNGYPNANVTIQVDPNNNRQLDISVNESNVQQYFTSFFMGPVSFTRGSHAQFSQPINLGSPQNYFGTGTLMGFTGFNGAANPNFWASIAGYCYAKDGGDEFASGFDGNVGNVHNGSYTLGGSFPTDCNPTQDNRINNGGSCDQSSHENCEFDPLGYSYVVNVPSGLNPAPHLYVFNEGFNPCLNTPVYSGGSLVTAPNPPFTSPLMDVDADLATQYPCGGANPANPTTFKTYYTLSGPTGNLGTHSANTSYTTSATGYPKWSDLTNQLGLNSGLPAGEYILNVSTLNATDNNNVMTSAPSFQDAGPSVGLHNYGLLVSTNTTTPSSNLTNGGTYVCSSGTCPTVYANTSTAEAVTIVSPGGTSSATAYLANVPTEAVGKLVTLKLWDPGDFAQYIQIIRPDGTVLGSEASNPTTINYAVFGADPDASANYGGTLPSPNNTPLASGTLSGCTDPVTGSAFAGATAPCFPVDGCTPLNAWNTGNQTPLTDCTTEVPQIGTNSWGAPNNRFGPSRYSDSMVELSFLAPTSGWYGISETTTQPQVHDTITLNLLINGLPPHLTP